MQNLSRRAKSFIKNLLVRHKLYYFAKSTFLYDLYSYFFLRDHWNRITRESVLLKSLLGEQPTIFDIGANGGSKTDIYRRIASKIICVEPDEFCVNILNQKFKRKDNVIVVPVAVSEENGTGVFHIQSPGSCVNTLSTKWKTSLETEKPWWWNSEGSIDFSATSAVDVCTLDRLIELYGTPDYIKIDVEGYELQALRGLGTPIRLLSFEANLPTFLNETLECLSLIRKLSHNYRFSYSIEEGMSGYLSDWLTISQIEDVVLNSGFGFIEILAFLDTKISE